MAQKEKSLTELLVEAKAINQEIERVKQKRLAEIEAELNGIGYTAVLASKAQKRTGGGSKPINHEAIANWLKETLKNGSMTEAELRDAYSKAGLTKRIRLSTWRKAGIIKEVGGKIVLK